MGFAEKESSRNRITCSLAGTDLQTQNQKQKKSVIKTLIGAEEQIQPQESIEIHEDKKHMLESKEKGNESLNQNIKIEQEILTKYSFLLNESLMNDLEKIAIVKGKCVAELIRELLEKEVEENKILIL